MGAFMRDQDHLKRALWLAREHSRSGHAGPFGAVVTRGGEIVGEGWNRVVETNDPTAHAEILAIRNAGVRLGTHVLEDCVLYCSCEPCPMCLSTIYWARIPRVVFAASAEDAKSAGFDDTLIAGELGLDWEGRVVEGVRLLEEEGKKVLQSWAENPHRIGY